MASRPIVSYDDLYSGDEAESTTQAEQQQQQRPHSASSHTSAEDGDAESLSVGDIIAQPGAWDDSDLVRAWDNTVEEYRRQHASLLGDSAFRATMHETESRVGEWSSVPDNLDTAETPSSKKRRRGEDPDLSTIEPGHEGYTGALPEYPEAPLNENDALSKLNMAWYHAGFYAGYYQAYRSGIESKSIASAEEANVGADAEADAVMDQEEAI
ncbi:hypothetical protein IWW39_001011 [Coemansia spiralis]|uniref:Survival Motor Neuron Gemin2-binding domain-containing protein n=1 Tax=Coemansia spiralis TaxID=417178 RepID=A0A9W8GR04_9FUNG|nr:hypothetical protein IWW39_001011 [Coemansia spiralis]